MGTAPCCEKMGLKKGPWTKEEDQILINYINENGHGNWRALPKKAGTSLPNNFITLSKPSASLLTGSFWLPVKFRPSGLHTPAPPELLITKASFHPEGSSASASAAATTLGSDNGSGGVLSAVLPPAADTSSIEVDAVMEAELKENGFRSTQRTMLICTIGYWRTRGGSVPPSSELFKI